MRLALVLITLILLCGCGAEPEPAAPAADAEVRDLDTAGRPQQVFDQGWRIDYTGYADDTAAALPRRLEISRGDARVRLIIDSWTALP